MRRANLIADERDGQYVALAAEWQTNHLVNRLVQHGIEIYEIAPEQQDLESFYLSLVRNAKSPSSVTATGSNGGPA